MSDDSSSSGSDSESNAGSETADSGEDPESGPEANAKGEPPAAEDLALTGAIPESQILDVVNKNGQLFDKCYLIGSGGGQQFVATVTVKATVGPKGNVQTTEIIKSTANNPKVDTCVADSFKKMTFPRPDGAATTTITFPMKFEGAEQIQ